MPDRSDDQRYRLGEVLGKGALATVVAVEGPGGERLAGKLLHDSQSQDASAVARFLQEAALLRRLAHPNLVRVVEIAAVAGRPMLVMERIDGPDLAAWIARDAPLAESQILAIGRGVASGLAHAHAAGVIHRDLKPGNVLLQANDPAPIPKIGDFGMARASSLDGVDHQAMTVVGTPDYMAPESIDPLAVDPRSDLYALGCILFEMAAGHPPYGAATPLGLLHLHRTAPIPALPDALSPGLRRLIERLLAKSPGDRPQAAELVVQGLDAIAGGDDSRALVLADESSGPARCTGCDQPLLPGVGLCLACGLPIAALDRGDFTVFITGPGSIGDKFETQLRDRLSAWIAGNPGLFLDAAPLAKRIPRLPFTLCTGVDEPGAQALVAALQRMGIDAVCQRGGAFRLKEMRKKSTTLTARLLAIIAASGMYSVDKVIWLLPIVLTVTAGVTVWSAVRKTTKALPRQKTTRPPAIAAALTKVEAVAPALAARRHRMALRAVVRRSLALTDGGSEVVDADELATAIEAAAAAAGRLDALDRDLERIDIREADDAIRARLHERDVWSARLLELTASLDAIQARSSAARHARAAAGADDRLSDLGARIEALEEIARLEDE